jgi:hypothetical protein
MLKLVIPTAKIIRMAETGRPVINNNFHLNRAEGPIEAFPGRNREKVDFKDGANGDSLIAEA